MLLALTRQWESSAPEDQPARDAGRDRLSKAAFALAEDASAPLASRATALSVASRVEPAESLALAKRLASTETAPFLLTACLPILRASSDAESLALLERLARTGHTHLRQQAAQALAKTNP